jgi:hypothetical protein
MCLKKKPYDNPASIKNSKLSTKKTNMFRDPKKFLIFDYKIPFFINNYL